VTPAAAQFAHDISDETFGIAEEHQGAVQKIQRVFDSGETAPMPRLITITVRALSTSRIGIHKWDCPDRCVRRDWSRRLRR